MAKLFISTGKKDAQYTLRTYSEYTNNHGVASPINRHVCNLGTDWNKAVKKAKRVSADQQKTLSIGEKITLNPYEKRSEREVYIAPSEPVQKPLTEKEKMWARQGEVVDKLFNQLTESEKFKQANDKQKMKLSRQVAKKISEIQKEDAKKTRTEIHIKRIWKIISKRSGRFKNNEKNLESKIRIRLEQLTGNSQG